jgi:hypothetical protein
VGLFTIAVEVKPHESEDQMPFINFKNDLPVLRIKA